MENCSSLVISLLRLEGLGILLGLFNDFIVYFVSAVVFCLVVVMNCSCRDLDEGGFICNPRGST